MDEAERLSLSTSLPELIKNIQVNTVFKATLISSCVIDDDTLDNLIERNNHDNGNLIFHVIQQLKRANEPETFSTFHKVLTDAGQEEPARLLQAELVKHSQRTKGPVGVDKSGSAAASDVVHPDRVTTGPGNPPGSLQDQQQREELDEQELAELEKALREVLPPRGTAKELGDAVVADVYYGKVYGFISSDGGPPPGPIPIIDDSKPFYEKGTGSKFCYLAPACCAKLNLTYGTRAILTYGRDGGHSVLRRLDSSVAYCLAHISLNPGSLHKRSIWMCARYTLRKVLSSLISWPQFVGRVEGTHEVLDLSITADEWYRNSRKMCFTVERLGRAAQDMSTAEKRGVLNHCLATGKDEEVKCPVIRGYGKEVSEFSSGQTDDEPGHVQVPSEKAPVYNVQNLKFLPVECCATLIEMYGGETPTLVRGSENGIHTLDNMDCSTKFILTQLHVYSNAGFRKDSPIGIFYFNIHSSLNDAIGAAIGWYPARARGHRDSRDLDLDMTVRQWFDTSKTTAIVLWVE